MYVLAGEGGEVGGRGAESLIQYFDRRQTREPGKEWRRKKKTVRRTIIIAPGSVAQFTKTTSQKQKYTHVVAS